MTVNGRASGSFPVPDTRKDLCHERDRNDPDLPRVLRRPGTLDELPTSLVGQTLGQFGQCEKLSMIREVLRGEERRFADLLTRGRKLLDQLGPGRPLTEADLRYLHQTHGIPPELVTELMD